MAHPKQERNIALNVRKGFETAVLLSIIYASNQFTFGQIFDAIGKRLSSPLSPEKALVIPKTDAAPPVPEHYQPGWVIEFLQKTGVPIPNMLDFPTGVDQIVRDVAPNHPLIKSAVRKSYERLLREPDGKTPLFGDFLKAIRQDLQAEVVFPPGYSERDKTQFLNDLMIIAASTTQDQFMNVNDVITLFGVDPKLLDGHPPTESMNFGGVLLSRQPRLYPNPVDACYNLWDAMARCLGPDRAQHTLSHALKTLWESDSLDTKNPNLAKTNFSPGQWILNFVNNLDIGKDEKIKIITYLVGTGWEVYESVEPLIKNLKDRTPFEMAIPIIQAQYWMKVLGNETTTGLGDPFFRNDLLGNREGDAFVKKLRDANSEEAVQRVLEQYNANPYISGGKNVYDENSFPFQISQRQQFLYILGEIASQNEPPSMRNEALMARAGEIAKRLNLTSPQTLVK